MEGTHTDPVVSTGFVAPFGPDGVEHSPILFAHHTKSSAQRGHRILCSLHEDSSIAPEGTHRQANSTAKRPEHSGCSFVSEGFFGAPCQRRCCSLQSAARAATLVRVFGLFDGRDGSHRLPRFPQRELPLHVMVSALCSSRSKLFWSFTRVVSFKSRALGSETHEGLRFVAEPPTVNPPVKILFCFAATAIK